MGCVRRAWVVPNGKTSMFARVPKAIIKSYKALYKRTAEDHKTAAQGVSPSSTTSGGPTRNVGQLVSPMERAITNSVNLDNLCKLIYTGDTMGRSLKDPFEDGDEISQ